MNRACLQLPDHLGGFYEVHDVQYIGALEAGLCPECRMQVTGWQKRFLRWYLRLGKLKMFRLVHPHEPYKDL